MKSSSGRERRFSYRSNRGVPLSGAGGNSHSTPKSESNLWDRRAIRVPIPLRALEYPWFHWFELLARAAREEGHAFSLPEDVLDRDLIWDFVFNRSQGIGTLIALRSHKLLSDFGVECEVPSTPERGTPLFELYENLRSRPEDLFRRVPY